MRTHELSFKGFNTLLISRTSSPGVDHTRSVGVFLPTFTNDTNPQYANRFHSASKRGQ